MHNCSPQDNIKISSRCTEIINEFTGTITISGLITPAHKLFEYMLRKDKHYGMTVMRMVPVISVPDADVEMVGSFLQAIF